MIIYAGMTRKRSYVQALRERGIGRIQQRGELRLGCLYPGERWCFDNGAFSDWINGRDFDGDAFMRDLEKIKTCGRLPQFVVLPDKPGQADSIEFSRTWLGKIPGRSRFHWYLPVQDGTHRADVDALLLTGAYRGLFIGGTDQFKQTTPTWVDLAHRHGLPCHYGRASTPEKMIFARNHGCDSCDSSFALWEHKRFMRWMLTGAPDQASLFERDFDVEDE